MKQSQNKTRSAIVIIIAAILVSPLDDIVMSALFGTAVFGFGSTMFYTLLIVSSVASVLIWKRNAVLICLRRFWQRTMQKAPVEHGLQIGV